ncbi:hypothetical protein [Streptomyces sp. BH104]|uniref:hypothetical protein n=1 Tax=Streptomyces sp. BH104 TaxID=3410407 RepID=UPI003BB80B20
MSETALEWVQEGDEWVVTINSTTYRSSYGKVFGEAGTYYVQGGTLSGEYRTLSRCLRAVIDHESATELR